MNAPAEYRGPTTIEDMEDLPVASPLDDTSSTPLVTELGIVFPTRAKPLSGGVPKARSDGVLFVDERSCLRFKRPSGVILLPIWPHGFGLVAHEDGAVLILDETGEPVAKVGDEVLVDGTSLGTLLSPDDGFLDEQKVRELTERCPGPYWNVGQSARVIE